VRFLADECCDEATVAALRHDGHDVVYAVESLRGAPDEEVLARAVSEQRILLTEDKDFGELVYALSRPAHGIVLLRFEVSERALKIPRLRELLEHHAERLERHFVVLESEKIRLRPLDRLTRIT
jgi:predicted nuclease of predicted toxin-antitoxin system